MGEVGLQTRKTQQYRCRDTPLTLEEWEKILICHETIDDWDDNSIEHNSNMQEENQETEHEANFVFNSSGQPLHITDSSDSTTNDERLVRDRDRSESYPRTPGLNGPQTNMTNSYIIRLLQVWGQREDNDSTMAFVIQENIESHHVRYWDLGSDREVPDIELFNTTDFDSFDEYRILSSCQNSLDHVVPTICFEE